MFWGKSSHLPFPETIYFMISLQNCKWEIMNTKKAVEKSIQNQANEGEK